MENYRDRHRGRGLAVTGVAVAAAVFVGGLQAAPASAEDAINKDIEAAALEEGKLTIYSSAVDTPIFLEKFAELYPDIETSSLRLVSSKLFARYLGEVQSGAASADLLISGSSALYEQQPEMFVPLTAENLPNMVNSTVKPLNPEYFPYEVIPGLVTYNINMVEKQELEEHLKSWEDLADPYWKGKLVLGDPKASTTYMSWYRTMRNTYGDDYIKAIGGNSVAFASSGVPAAQEIAAGAYAMGAPLHYSHSRKIRADGAPVETYVPEGPSHGVEVSMALPKTSSNPNAALLFANFLLSEGAQAVICTLGVEQVTPGECAAPSSHVGPTNVIPEDEQNEIEALLGYKSAN